ncbi:MULTISPECIES: PE-PGRS family protein [Protofrankia]|uniref:PE-PGRS family protein n=1 Tax=Candidatus Protofrankia datiscae TaxID=2716812 RepID=F8AXI1_9ACTN|nr:MULTISPECIES: PE-PGRS family protein [Protofrankia]AEH09468.1 PE-PGRS family protein [Candidatus Protofrankia datiscae]
MISSPVGGWLDGVDMVAVVRGSSRGFTVLVLGGLVAPAVATVSGALGALVLTGSAAAAFVVAALRQGTTTDGGRHGALAAVGAYLLVLPLVLLAQAGRNPAQISMTLAAAVIVGFVAGSVATRRRSPGSGRSGGNSHSAAGSRGGAGSHSGAANRGGANRGGANSRGGAARHGGVSSSGATAGRGRGGRVGVRSAGERA